MINFRIIFNILGLLLLIEGIFMFFAFPVSLSYNEGDLLIISISSFISIFSGGLIWYLTRKADKNIGKREGYLIVSFGWILFSVFGSLPFVLSGHIPSYTNAFFETVSGFTTTGASILEDIEALPHWLLFWRSMTQWLGGMGIIVMSLAILPILGIGGMQLFIAEVPGPVPDKLHPRIKETAKRLWGIYILFTITEFILLSCGGMDKFDAICHSFTTMATGGYSTKQASIGHFDSAFIHYVIIVFMFLAGTNFTLSYFALHFNFKKVFKNEEFRFYIGTLLFFTLLLSITLIINNEYGVEQSFRNSLFQVVSIVTTTGYVTADYIQWMPSLIVIIFIMMFFGGSAGSTGGGIKMIRVLMLFKSTFSELKKLIHPSAVIPVRYNHHAVSPTIISNILSFAFIYILILVIGMLVMSTMGYNLDSSFGAVAATLGNIGPGIGDVGPIENYNHIPVFGKWFLSFLMIVGRLELFTILILFSRVFWKK